MASVLGLLEAKESAAREEVARVAAVLEEAERVLERPTRTFQDRLRYGF
ncbi:hypothetical protein OTB20_34155 [Streptomyces sp. H27-H1]|nr:hypothetical protein [Streptomyces sp. H27-H1]MCY0931141.1 hypothetical protein [Streptomyces sp. H27-H1]